MQKKPHETNYCASVTLVLLWPLVAVGAVQQQQAWGQQGPAQSSALPAVEVLFLKTYTHLAYGWKHEIKHVGAWNSSSSSNGTTLAVHR